MTDHLAARPVGAILVAALVAVPGASAAQSFSGTGPGATSPFVLLAGERAVAVTAAAPGSFTAYLLSQNGSVVATLSGAGEQEIEVPGDGRYLFDVRAIDAWTIRLEEPDMGRIDRLRGRIDGAEAAEGTRASAAWLGKGLAGGLLLGPLGTLIAVNRAGRGEPTLPEAVADRLAGEGPGYAEAFREGYTDQWRGSQRSAALVGGLTGTAMLAFAIFQVVTWGEPATAQGELPGGTGETAASVPIIRVSFPR